MAGKEALVVSLEPMKTKGMDILSVSEEAYGVDNVRLPSSFVCKNLFIFVLLVRQ